MGEEMQCLSSQKAPAPALHSSDLELERDKAQTPLVLCDESRGKAALRETAGLSPAAGQER